MVGDSFNLQTEILEQVPYLCIYTQTFVQVEAYKLSWLLDSTSTFISKSQAIKRRTWDVLTSTAVYRVTQNYGCLLYTSPSPRD